MCVCVEKSTKRCRNNAQHARVYQHIIPKRRNGIVPVSLCIWIWWWCVWLRVACCATVHARHSGPASTPLTQTSYANTHTQYPNETRALIMFNVWLGSLVWLVGRSDGFNPFGLGFPIKLIWNYHAHNITRWWEAEIFAKRPSGTSMRPLRSG